MWGNLELFIDHGKALARQRLLQVSSPTKLKLVEKVMLRLTTNFCKKLSQREASGRSYSAMAALDRKQNFHMDSNKILPSCVIMML